MREKIRHSPSLRSKLAVAFYCFTFGSFTWVWLSLLYGAYHYPTVVVPPVVAWLGYVLLVDHEARFHGWEPSCRNLSVWTYMRSYFPSTELVVHGDLASDAGGKPSMYLYHPHGVLAFGSWLAFGCNALGLDDRLSGCGTGGKGPTGPEGDRDDRDDRDDCGDRGDPGDHSRNSNNNNTRSPPRLVTLNINFFAPFLREFLLAHGVCSCAKKALIGLLRRNESVALVVGGGSESLLSKQGEYHLVLRRRRGFAKVALATGCNLVPVVGFGETDCYSTWNDWKIVRSLQKRIERTLGFTVPIAVGRGFFLPFGLLPHSRPLRIVVGRAVPVEKWVGSETGETGETGGGRDGRGQEAYERAVEDVKRRYEEALLDVFEEEGVSDKVRIVE